MGWVGPVISNVLLRSVWPLTRWKVDFETIMALASALITAALAWPLSGAAVTLTLSDTAPSAAR